MANSHGTTTDADSFAAIGISIRPARVEELPSLDALILRSKAHWTGGRTEDLPAATPRLTTEDIAVRHATVAEKDGVPIGLYTLDEHEDYLGIGLLFVDRPFIGTGVGRLLWDHLRRCAITLGARKIGVGAEPNAEGFYKKMGMVSQGAFVHKGERLIWMIGETGDGVSK